MFQLSRYSEIQLGYVENEIMVYFAKDNSTEKPVQMKIQNSPHAHQQNRILSGEVDILLRLKGIIGIPEIIDYGYTSNQKFYLVSTQTGNTLQQYIRAKKQLDATTIISIGQQLLEILQRIHFVDVYHTNLSPQYISVYKNQVYLHGFYFNNLDYREKMKFKEMRFLSKQLNKECCASFKDDLESLGYLIMYLVDYELNRFQNKNCGSNESRIFFRSYFELLPKLSSTSPPPYLHFKKIIQRIVNQCLSDENKIKIKQNSKQLGLKQYRTQNNKLSMIKEDELENIVSKQFVKINVNSLFENKITQNIDLENSFNQTFEISEEKCQISEMIQNLHNQNMRTRSIASLSQYKQ